MPALFDAKSLLKTQIMFMDEDLQLCGSFLSSIDMHLSKCGPDALTGNETDHIVPLIIVNFCSIKG